MQTQLVTSIGNAILTTDHAASSHGQPVLVINDVAYGPADVIGDSVASDIVLGARMDDSSFGDPIDRILDDSITQADSDAQGSRWVEATTTYRQLKDRFCGLMH